MRAWRTATAWLVGAGVCVLALAGCGPTTTGAAGRWSSGAPSGLTGALAAISCPPSANAAAGPACLVVAVDNQAVLWRASGTTPVPSAPGPGGENDGPVDVSCASATFCALAELNGRIPIFDGTGWADEQVLDGQNAPIGVDCPAAMWCVAVDQDGNDLRYTGQWSSPQSVPPAGEFAGLSCTSTQFCLAVTSDTPSLVLRYDGASWKQLRAPALPTPEGGSEPNVLSDVSCVSPTWCLAVDSFGNYYTWNGSSWSSATAFGKNLEDTTAEVSCASASLCMIIDEDGGATPVVHGQAGARQVVTPGDSSLTAVSCPTARRCEAVATNAKVYTYTTGSS